MVICPDLPVDLQNTDPPVVVIEYSEGPKVLLLALMSAWVVCGITVVALEKMSLLTFYSVVIVN